jgi:hypothetical protein
VGTLDSTVLGCWEGVTNKMESVRDGIIDDMSNVGRTVGIALLEVDMIGLVLGLPDCSMLGVAEYIGLGIPEVGRAGLEVGPNEP